MAVGHDDPLIRQLQEERSTLEHRMSAIDNAIEALTGTSPSNGGASHRVGRGQVGDDKLDAVRQYIRERGKVRQAEITQELGFNSGTVSTAVDVLCEAGEIEQGPKENRSKTWLVK